MSTKESTKRGERTQERGGEEQHRGCSINKLFSLQKKHRGCSGVSRGRNNIYIVSKRRSVHWLFPEREREKLSSDENGG